MRSEDAPPTDVLVRRVRGEFLEMPGLRLTTAQACRLWGMEPTVCTSLLHGLVDEQFLFQTRDGAFIRTERAAPLKAAPRTRSRHVDAA